MAPRIPQASSLPRQPNDYVRDGISALLTKIGLGGHGDSDREAQRRAQNITEMLDFTGVGNAQGLYDAAQMTRSGVRDGNYLEAGGGLALGALGLIPGAGKVAVKGAKKGVGILKTAMRAVEDGADTMKALPKKYDKILQNKMPQVAERYPIEGYPALGIDKNKIEPRTGKMGKMFPEKNLSEEARQVQKMRVAAQEKIDAGDYTPYFDPAKRFDVNSANYPDFAESTTSLRAPTPAVNARKTAEANDPEAIARLRTAYLRGSQQADDAGNWYHMGQLEDEYIKEYGPEAGRMNFQKGFAEPMAATTGGADPSSNLMMAHYGNYLKTHGKDIPEDAFNFPFPVGGRYAGGNMKQYNKMLMGSAATGTTLANPKRYTFAGNFLGHKDPTMDEQMLTGMYGSPKWNKNQPVMSVDSDHYGTYQQPVIDLANEYGVEPRYLQEVAWAGNKDAKMEADALAKLAKKAGKGGVPIPPGIGHNGGPQLYYKAKPMISQVNEAIERTHQITGMPRDEIVRRGLVRREIPLYAMPFAAGGLGAASMYGNQNDDQGPQY